MKKVFFPVILALFFPCVLHAQMSPELTAQKDYTAAVAWQQHSGEYRALSFQAYNFAKLSLNEKLKEAGAGKVNCVIVDIDETLLDNSPFSAMQVQKGIAYNPKDWSAWTSLAAADTVPGALSFLRYAASKQVETFYISNRTKADYQATLANLQRLGFPFADEEHLMLSEGTSDKEARRKRVMEQHHVLLFCGDNLSDFSNIFYREGKNTREEVDAAMAEFGTKFIVLPNPMYGDWEKLLYKGSNLDETEKSRQRIKGLKGF
jgi:5'-nucleotidase (lipoprotein e(P4) family)